MGLHAFNSGTWEAEAGEFLWVWGQPGQNEFQNNQGYKKQNKQTNNPNI